MPRFLCALLALTFSLHAQDAWQRIASPSDYVIVELRSDSRLASQSAAAELRRDLAALGHSRIRREYSVVFHGVALQIDRAMLPAIAALPYVVAIHPDEEVEALAIRIASGAAPAIHADLGSGGEGVTIAVLDTGIDYTHPALGNGFGPGFKIAGGYDFVNGDDDPRDDNGHGTHVAGIIAAEASEVTGIAPRSTLVAYKVLDAFGSGRQSDVIAALERVVDPNGDGDPSDHLDVANLSLGSIGTPDDPQSQAVDAAVAAGVIVCVAAGNDGESFAIRSPGAAQTAITVGALGEDLDVAPFSSRGPSVKLVSIKPDVLAPGMKIRSTFFGGGYAVMDGTSMATAYVSGACALLRALHREWTPLEVKTAITMTAVPLAASAMDQGAGVLDLAAATSVPLVASESHFSFGLDATQNGAWEATRSITITNITEAAGVYEVATTMSDPSIRVSTTPRVLRVQPGSSASISVTVRVDHDFVATGAPEEFRGGIVTLTSGGDELHFAWAVVTSSRATLSMERSCASFYLLSMHAPRQPRKIDANAVEAYAPAGTYELVAIGQDAEENGPTDVVLIANEITIAGDVTIHFTRGDAPYTIALRGTDERGAPLTGDRYISRFRIHAPPYRRFQGFEIVTRDGRLATSSVRTGFEIKAGEIRVDAAQNRIVALQYPVLREVSRDISMDAVADRHQRIRFVHAHGSARRELTVSSVAIDVDAFSSLAVETFDTFGSSWAGDLHLNEEADDGHVLSVALQAGEPGRAADVATTALRVRNGRFVASNAAEPSPLAYITTGEVVTFGDGPVLVSPHVIASPEALHSCVRVIGAAGECLPRAAQDGALTVYDEGGQVLAEHHGDSIDMPRSPGGAERVEFVTSGLSTAMEPMRATLAITVGNTAAITSIAILDVAGTMTSTLRRHEAGALVFTAAAPLRIEQTRVWFRRSGTSEWIALTPIPVNDDTSFATAPLGIQFITDLTPATTRGGAIELRISLDDSMILTLEPAFAVAAGRSRAIAHR